MLRDTNTTTSHQCGARLLNAVFAALMAMAVLALGGCQSAARAPAVPVSKERMEIFLLAGQSNMAGRGPVEAVDRETRPNLFCLNAQSEWVLAAEPLHFDRPQRVGVGPGGMFGRIVADAWPDVRIGLVPAACGGSPIEVWSPGAHHKNTNSHPYDDAVARTQRALRDGRLRGILWIQGESDSNAERAPLYYERLRALIVNLRRELNAPDVPFIIGQLPRFEEQEKNAWRGMVTESHREVARELPGVYFVDMPVLTALGDGVHASAASAREMGRLLAEACLKITASAP